MIEQLKNVNKIYDLMALCCSYILKNSKLDPYEFSFFDDKEYEYVEDAIYKYSCDIKNIGKVKAFKELKKFLLNFMQNDISIEKCYAVVLFIDENIEIEIPSGLLEVLPATKYGSLNDQYKDEIKIFPNNINRICDRKGINNLKLEMDGILGTSSDFRKSRDCYCSELDEFLSNYSIWDKEYIDKYPLTIYHISESSDIGEHFRKRNKVVFGVAPLTKKDIKDLFCVEYKQNAFYIKSLKEEAENQIKQRFKEIYKRSREKDIDFLIFPEMLITQNIVNTIKDEYDEKDGYPEFIINGSISKDGTNKSIITDGVGNEIFSYFKKTSFYHRVGKQIYREYLDKTKNRDYVILEIEHYGRIGIGICKDLTNENFKIFQKSMKTDILIIPSYTPSLDLLSSAKEISEEYLCTVIVVNACSAINDKNSDDIGFLTYPGKDGTRRCENIQMFSKKSCKKNCEIICEGRIITVNFEKGITKNRTLSYNVTEMPL